MTGRIGEEDVEKVKSAARIEMVAADYVHLSNGGGGQLKGLCPFHDEKSPSFYVSPSKGLFNCFGCHEAGDVLGLVMKLENLGFTQAVEQLAARFGVELDPRGEADSPRTGQRMRLQQAVELAARFYTAELTGDRGEHARQFLGHLGVDRAACEAFGLGYAPRGPQHLKRHLTRQGFSEQELVSAGLCLRGSYAGADRLQDRLVWPVRDSSGRILGLGGAAETGGDGLLSAPAASALYRPGYVLFGVDLARKSIAHSGRVVVASDYGDVTACHLVGATDAVGVCGASLGAGHLAELRKLLAGNNSAVTRVLFTGPLPDGAIPAVLADPWVAARAAVAASPSGKGAWRIRAEHGAEGVGSLLENPVPFYSYAVQAALVPHDLTTLAGRLAALEGASGTIARIKDGLLQRQYAARLVEWLGGPEWLGGADVGRVAARVRELAAGPATPGQEGGEREAAPGVRKPSASQASRRVPQPGGASQASGVRFTHRR
jgi:DNA primase